MPTCKLCTSTIPPGRIYCDADLNNWITMRKVINDHFKVKYGPETRQTVPLMINDMKYLNNLWKRDRLEFEKQVWTLSQQTGTT